MNKRKGIILAGGLGTRLYPSTLGSSKQTLPIYNKPMIYYPLSLLMQINVREIALICTKDDLKIFKKILGNGSDYGVNLKYLVQKTPNGIPMAFKICEKFIKGSPSVLILGDNIFFGHDLPIKLKKLSDDHHNASIVTVSVKNPENFGVVTYKKENKIKNIKEKPKKPKSNFISTGLYFLPSDVNKNVKKLRFSKRGELEIPDLLNIYLKKNKLKSIKLGRGFAWFDTGTHDNMMAASNFIKNVEDVQKFQIGNIHEIAYLKKFINFKKFMSVMKKFEKSSYGEYLLNIKENLSYN